MSANELKGKRSLSVNQRLLTLGVAAFAGFGAMIAIGWYQNDKVASVLLQQQTISGQVASLNEMRIANLDMVLAAMDTIVDKDEGTVVPERIEIMKKSIAMIRSQKATVENLASLTGLSEAAKTFDADLNEVEKAVLTELPSLVQAKASTAEFAKIDDAIDGGGERLAQLLTKLAEQSKEVSAATVVAAQDSSAQSLYWQMGLGLLSILAMAILFPVHSIAIRRGVAGIRDSLNRILNDDLDTPVVGKERGDEFGDMAHAAETLRLSSLEKRDLTETGRKERERNESERAAREAARIEEEAQVRFAVDALAAGLSQLADGDLTVSLERPFREDLERVRGDFNRAVEKLQGVISEVMSNTGSIEANSSQMRNAADDLSKRTEQQAASLEETSAALEQITSTVKNTSGRADEATQMVDGTRANAERSGKVVTEAMSAMQRIETASNEIGKIINVIDEIAFQTNLLALNAGVEAARAGDAGKGFAVVAQEVRELAGRAAGAAKDIKTLVAKSSEEVRTGVQLVTATGEALTHIADDVARINTIVRSIATSANEQATGIQEINTAISQMDQMTQQNAAMVEQTNAASHTLAQDAGNLTALISQFRISAGHSPARGAPQVATTASRPKISPARNLVTKLAGAFNAKPAAKIAVGATDSNWEEF